MAHDLGKLSEREREVLRLLARGYDIKTAAIQLSISPSAVSDRLRQARRKLAVSSSREAARIFNAHEANGAFHVHTFSGMPKASVLPQSAHPGTLAKNGMAMTTLIAAAAFISLIATDHSTSDWEGARPASVQQAKRGTEQAERTERKAKLEAEQSERAQHQAKIKAEQAERAKEGAKRNAERARQ